MFGQDWAAECIDEAGVARLTCLPSVIQNIVGFALIASGVVAVFFIIWAGIKLVTSSGDQKKIDEGRKTLTWAIIGLIIILMAYMIVMFIGQLTGTQDCINKVGFNNTGCK